MSWTTKAFAVLCISVGVTATPAMAGHANASQTQGMRGPAVPGAPRPFASMRPPTSGATQTRLAAPPSAPPTLVTRPAPPFRHTPSAPQTVITRPVPPFHRASDGFQEHHHHHGPVFVFVEPRFFGSAPFGYPYAYSSSFYAFGPSLGSPAAGYASSSTAPFFCWVDQIGFIDEARFAHHLHEVHGVPLEDALSYCEPVGGRCVFFGF